MAYNELKALMAKKKISLSFHMFPGALTAALELWNDAKHMAVNVDLDSTGIREKTGLEIYPAWRHPVLVDRMVSRLERAGLCRTDKGQALRRWVQIPPDPDPFIQTLINHYKMNYANGKITEAKAYLEQSPFPKHRFTQPAGKN